MKKCFIIVSCVLSFALTSCSDLIKPPELPTGPVYNLNGTAWVMDYSSDWVNYSTPPKYLPAQAKMLRYMTFGGDNHSGLISVFEEIQGWSSKGNVPRPDSPGEVLNYTITGPDTMSVTNSKNEVMSLIIQERTSTYMNAVITSGTGIGSSATLNRLPSIPAKSTLQIKNELLYTIWKSSLGDLITFTSSNQITQQSAAGSFSTVKWQFAASPSGGNIQIDLVDGVGNKIGYVGIDCFTLNANGTSFFKQ